MHNIEWAEIFLVSIRKISAQVELPSTGSIANPQYDQSIFYRRSGNLLTSRVVAKGDFRAFFEMLGWRTSVYHTCAVGDGLHLQPDRRFVTVPAMVRGASTRSRRARPPCSGRTSCNTAAHSRSAACSPKTSAGVSVSLILGSTSNHRRELLPRHHLVSNSATNLQNR